MSYVDGFVVPVPKKKRAAYVKMARKAGKVWKDHGALDYNECLADDVKLGQAHLVPAQREAEEERGGLVLVHRLQQPQASRRVMKKVMKDKRLAAMMDMKSLPFDAQAHDLRRLQGRWSDL